MNAEAREQDSAVDYWLVTDRALVRLDDRVAERPVSIGVHDARIAVICEAADLRDGERKDTARRLGQEVIDVGAQPVVPSFVNGHSHLALAPLRGITSVSHRAGNVVTDVFFRVERHLTAADVRVFTRLGAFESLLCGVGEVWDHYYFGKEVALGLAEAGLTGVVAPTLQDVSGPGVDQVEEQIEVTLALSADAALAERGITSAWGPHASDTVSDTLMERIAAQARQSGLPLHLHLAQSSEEMTAAARRSVPRLASHVHDLLQGCRVLMAHGLYLSDADCELLARAAWVLGYCPYSQLQFGVLSPLGAWLAAHGNWAIGTDCVASNDALDIQRELAFAGGDAALRASFSPARKQFSATGKKAAGVEEARGASLREPSVAHADALLHAAHGYSLDHCRGGPAGITRGALANLLVLNPAHPSLYPGDDLQRSLAYGATSGAIDWCVVAGSQRGREGGLPREVLESALYRDTLIEARRRRDELFERAQMIPARPTS